jgi:riboflavin kinase/FMN adenylyltransferase
VCVVLELDQLDSQLRGCALTIGNFDGVHRGHQQIIAQAGLLAASTSSSVAVMTFHPHPLELLRPTEAPARLMTLENKVRMLRAAGADAVVLARSTPQLLGLLAAEFVDDVIVDRIGPAHVVEGETFGFGRGRLGTPQLLQELGPQAGFAVCIVPQLSVQVDGSEMIAVSSSLIRDLLKNGHVHRARLCLGRPYSLNGRVEAGQGRGADLGFPTVNLGHISQLVPADGVYAGWGCADDTRYPAAISIGTTPTFDGHHHQIEAHLLGCDESLYERAVRLEFGAWLRSQQKFDNAGALVDQIAADVTAVRDYVASVVEGT